MNRDALLFTARAYLAESQRRGRQPFAFTLLTWAGNARRRAMAVPRAPEQSSLFPEHVH